jgi:predicted nucleic acid-binding protein
MATEDIVNETSPVTVDANIAIALSCKERDKYDEALQVLTKYAEEGRKFYAPGVLIGEVLFVLCKKLMENLLSNDEHSAAILEFVSLMDMISPPPDGDRSIISRAEQIRGNYGCARSADGLYIALAEQLANDKSADLLTYDAGMVNQAKSISVVHVNLLKPRIPDDSSSKS